jgi:FkbM family methyltransferase
MEYKSQYGQDKFVDKFFKEKTNGVFLDIGAHDGVFLSNSYFLEKQRNWSGICFEPNPRLFNELIKNRSCICVEGAATDKNGEFEFLDIEGVEALGGLIEKYDSRHLDRIDKDIVRYNAKGKNIISVRGYNINEVLLENKMTNIDYLSIDTEGGELSILKGIDFNKIKIKVITVEVNYPESSLLMKIKNFFLKNSIDTFLNSKGYKLIAKLNCDEVYILKSI